MGSFVSTVLRLAVAAFLLFTATLTFDAAARMIGLGKDACGTSINSLPRMLSAYFKGADIADSAEAICAGMKQAMRDIPGDEEPKAFINREVSKALAAGDDFVAKSWVEAAPDILGSENAAPEEFLSAKTLKAYNAAAGKDRNAFQKWWDSLADAAGGFLATFSCKREAPNFSAFAGAVASDVIAVGDVRDIAIYGCAELKAQGGENIACSTIWNFSEDCRNLEPDSFVLGLSAAGVLKPELRKEMAEKPLVLALANPTPEIMPALAREARPDAMICTGRSDFPNQVNNVLCFPYIFRGALDVGASAINEDMKMAAVHAIASLAREEPSDVAARAYSGETPIFGPDFLIPSPFDPRLILRIAPAVAKAACETGVATRPITDMDAYVDRLTRFVFRSGLVMKPVFSAARQVGGKRVVYADGEDERVLRAAQVVIEEGIAEPILIGRPQVVETRLRRYGLRIRAGTDFELVNPEDDPRYRDYVDLLVSLTGRRGITPEAARTLVRTNSTVIAALALVRGEADAMICGLEGRFERHLRNVDVIVGRRSDAIDLSALSMLISDRGAVFLTDTYVTVDPTAEELAEMTVLAAEEIRRFGLEPKAALLSHSNFGSRDSASALKMRRAAELIHEMAPDLQADGEMHGDSALSVELRNRVYPHSALDGEANLLVFPNLDAANIALTTIKSMTDALHVGPILLGTQLPAHILTPSVTSRGVVNMTALAVVEAAQRSAARQGQ